MHGGNLKSNRFSKIQIALSVKVNVKQSRYPEGPRRFRLQVSRDIRHTKVVRLSALHTGRLYPQEINLVLISVRN
jgi:hypothetical protein